MLTAQDQEQISKFIPPSAVSDVIALFELANSKGDLCLQGGGNPVVFGGFNRVYVYQNGLIKISRFHCSDRFIKTARELGFEII